MERDAGGDGGFTLELVVGRTGEEAEVIPNVSLEE